MGKDTGSQNSYAISTESFSYQLTKWGGGSEIDRIEKN